jgi:hypothetical protein
MLHALGFSDDIIRDIREAFFREFTR